jgi:hypothetical protein
MSDQNDDEQEENDENVVLDEELKDESFKS